MYWTRFESSSAIQRVGRERAERAGDTDARVVEPRKRAHTRDSAEIPGWNTYLPSR